MARLYLVPQLPRYVTLQHPSGARREVQVLAVAGLPPRVQVWWPLCGVYAIGHTGALLPEFLPRRRRRIAISRESAQLALWPDAIRAQRRGAGRDAPVSMSLWAVPPRALPTFRAVVFQFRTERLPKC